MQVNTSKYEQLPPNTRGNSQIRAKYTPKHATTSKCKQTQTTTTTYLPACLPGWLPACPSTSLRRRPMCTALDQAQFHAHTHSPGQGRCKDCRAAARHLRGIGHRSAFSCANAVEPAPSSCVNAVNHEGCAASMREHLNRHAAGSLAGAVPRDFMRHHGLGHCRVCSRTLHVRYRSVCPGMCRQLAQATGVPAEVWRQAASIGAQAASFPLVQSKLEPCGHLHQEGRRLKHVPNKLRASWSQCFFHTLAKAAHSNDASARKEVQMLPECVLCAPSRSGRAHQNQRLALTRSRLQRWLAGERTTLWQNIPPQGCGACGKARSGAALQALRQLRCVDFCWEGADSKA